MPLLNANIPHFFIYGNYWIGTYHLITAFGL